MIIEQALLYLPEILTGSGYPEQHYEGGIVAAFSLATLQALNGRNIPNPIACLQTERAYRGRRSWPGASSARPRYLRADLYVNVDQIRVGSLRLSTYGWRFHNWIEAKFFRKSTTIQQDNTAHLLADLLRLLVLTPNDRASNDDQRHIVGRYLLHVYESSKPDVYLSMSRNIGAGRSPRKWLRALVQHGHQRCPRTTLKDSETSGVLDIINSKLGDLSIEFTATNLRIDPVLDLGTAAKQYVCILSRIDSCAVARNGAELAIAADRTVAETPDSTSITEHVTEHVARWISVKGDIEEQQPDPVEVDDPSR